jgi:cytochrome P450
MVKRLASAQDYQSQLRASLRSAFSTALASGRSPSASEIARASVPRLDAFIQECLRMDTPVPLTARDAIVDTSLLGCPVPKGTEVFILASGPDYKTPSLPLPPRLAAAAERAKERDNADADADDGAKAQEKQLPLSQPSSGYGSWDPADMHEFKPERWLRTGGDDDHSGSRSGEGETYDARAGPLLAFGLGPRGCFGRRLAYLEARMLVVLLVWHFYFHATPAELSSFAAGDSITSVPKQCYVQLSKIS